MRWACSAFTSAWNGHTACVPPTANISFPPARRSAPRWKAVRRRRRSGAASAGRCFSHCAFRGTLSHDGNLILATRRPPPCLILGHLLRMPPLAAFTSPAAEAAGGERCLGMLAAASEGTCVTAAERLVVALEPPRRGVCRGGASLSDPSLGAGMGRWLPRARSGKLTPRVNQVQGANRGEHSPSDL